MESPTETLLRTVAPIQSLRRALLPEAHPGEVKPALAQVVHIIGLLGKIGSQAFKQLKCKENFLLQFLPPAQALVIKAQVLVSIG
jgi:hypothetical protein